MPQVQWDNGKPVVKVAELRKDGKFEALLNLLEAKISHLEVFGTKFESLADRWTGGSPPTANSPMTNATPSAYFDWIEYSINRLDRLCEHLNRQYDRIND